jgi:hypothetical protein
LGFYQSDIVVAPVWGNVGEAPPTGMLAYDGVSVLSGGVDYESTPEDKHCRWFDADGMQCHAWKSSDDGWCAGHRKAAAKKAQ